MQALQRPSQASHAIVAFFCFLFPLTILILYWRADMHGMQSSSDFAIYFSTAQTLHGGSWAIYDRVALERYLHHLTAKIEGVHFPYTPIVALLIAPLGGLPYSTAYWLWNCLGIIVFAWAQAIALKRFYPLWSARFCVAVSLLTSAISPFTVFNIIPGQSGFFSSAGLVMAVVWAQSSPWRAGTSLAFVGLISPRIAAVGTVVLLCGRCWKPVVWAMAIGLLMIMACLLASGVQPWLDWFHYLHAFSQLFAMNPHWLKRLSCSFFVMLRLLNLPFLAVMAGWCILAVLVIKSALPVVRRVRDMSAWPLAMTGAVLLLPYAMWYDLVFLNLPLIWLLDRINKTGFYAGELGWLCVVAVVPPLSILELNEYINVSPLALIIFYGLLVRRLAVQFSADSRLIA